MDKKTILVLNQYYAPDISASGRIAAGICAGLAGRGRAVHVIAGRPSYSRSSPPAPPRETLDGVRVRRVPLGNRGGRERMTARIAGYIGYLLGAWRESRKILKSESAFSTLLAFSNPPLIGYVAARLAEKYGLRLVWVLHDIHPDILLAAGWRLPPPLVRIWEAANRAVFDRADAVVVLSEDMKRTLVENKGVPASKIAVIPVWGMPDPAPPECARAARGEWRIADGELALMSSGNMGVTLPLEEILDAAARLAGRPVRFFFTGEGPGRRILIERLGAEKTAPAEILPYLDDARFARLLSAADLCLAGVRPGLEDLAFPSRIPAAMSAGRPVIAIGDPRKDPARWIASEGCGWAVENGRELAELVLSLLGNRTEIEKRGTRARGVYEARFSRSKVVEAFASLLS